MKHNLSFKKQIRTIDIIIFLLPFMVLGFILIFSNAKNIEYRLLSEKDVQLEMLNTDLDSIINSAFQVQRTLISNPTFLKDTILKSPYNEFFGITSLQDIGLIAPAFDEILVYYYDSDDLYCNYNKKNTSEFLALHKIELSDFKGIANSTLKSLDYLVGESHILFALPIVRNESVCVLSLPKTTLEHSLQQISNGVDCTIDLILFDKLECSVSNSNNSFSIAYNEYFPNSVVPEHDAVTSSHEGDFVSTTIQLDKEQFILSALKENFNIFIAMIATLLIGIVMILYFTKKTYAPISSILSQIYENNDLKTGEMSNEIQYIKDFIDKNQTENDTMKVKLNDYKDYIKLQKIKNLLFGDISNYNLLNKQYTDMSFQFPYPYFFVLSLSAITPLQSQQVLNYLDNLSACQTEGFHYISYATIENMELVLILNTPVMEHDHVFRKDLPNNILKEIQPDYATIHIGVGQIYSQLIHIKNSYIESISCLNSFDKAVYFHENVQQNYKENLFYLINKNNLLFTALKKNSKEVIIVKFNDICDYIIENFYNEQTQVTMLTNTIYYLISATEKRIPVFSKKCEESLTSTTDFNDMRNSILLLIELHFLDELDDSKKFLDIISQIEESLNENFTNNKLSLEWLSSSLGFSSSYVSKLIRTHMNTTFSEYIFSLRISYIIEKLTSCDDKISDIILSSGYIDVSNFTRKFKSLYGLTPSEYRKEHVHH